MLKEMQIHYFSFLYSNSDFTVLNLGCCFWEQYGHSANVHIEIRDISDKTLHYKITVCKEASITSFLFLFFTILNVNVQFSAGKCKGLRMKVGKMKELTTIKPFFLLQQF